MGVKKVKYMSSTPKMVINVGRHVAELFLVHCAAAVRDRIPKLAKGCLDGLILAINAVDETAF